MEEETDQRKEADIFDCAPLLSDALYAMVMGLEDSKKNPYFTVDMGTFGEWDENICYGCAATCALQWLGGDDLPESHIVKVRDRAAWFNFPPDQVEAFEMAIEIARSGFLDSLFSFYGTSDIDKAEIQKIFVRAKLHGYKVLDGDNWEKNLPRFKDFVYTIKEAGY